MREIVVAEKTVLIANGKTTTVEKRYSGILEDNGIFHLRRYSGKRFVEAASAHLAGDLVQQNEKEAASAA